MRLYTTLFIALEITHHATHCGLKKTSVWRVNMPAECNILPGQYQNVTLTEMNLRVMQIKQLKRSQIGCSWSAYWQAFPFLLTEEKRRKKKRKEEEKKGKERRNKTGGRRWKLKHLLPFYLRSFRINYMRLFLRLSRWKKELTNYHFLTKAKLKKTRSI